MKDTIFTFALVLLAVAAILANSCWRQPKTANVAPTPSPTATPIDDPMCDPSTVRNAK